jgi:hypothetical protein
MVTKNTRLKYGILTPRKFAGAVATCKLKLFLFRVLISRHLFRFGFGRASGLMAISSVKSFRDRFLRPKNG